MNNKIIPAAGLLVAGVLAAGCASGPPVRAYTANVVRNGQLVTVHRTTTLTPLESDARMCRLFNRDTNNDDTQRMARDILAAGTSVTYTLRHDLAQYAADLEGTVSSSVQGLVKVTGDCVAVQTAHRIPGKS